jgi:hypothetical protein
MKNKKILIIGFFICLFLFVTGRVVSQNSQITRIDRACQTRNGFLLAKDEDGFGRIKSCPKRTREVILGEEGSIGESNVSEGYILFIDTKMLTRDGKVWHLGFVPNPELGEGEGDEEWMVDELVVAVDENKINSVIQWDGVNLRFLLRNGDVYEYNRDSDSWQKIENISMPEATL